MAASASASRPLPLTAARKQIPASDEELADALVAGEAWAATATWNKYTRMVFRFLQRALGPAADVEGLTQEAFLGVFSNVRGLRNREALRSYIYSVAVRTLRRELRRQRVHIMFDPAPLKPLAGPAVPSLDAESRQAVRRLYVIIARLDAQERMAFVLRHFEGLPFEGVAAALNVSVATAKRRVRAATELVSNDAALAPYAYPKRSRWAVELRSAANRGPAFLEPTFGRPATVE